jgi:hypothetical protein
MMLHTISYLVADIMEMVKCIYPSFSYIFNTYSHYVIYYLLCIKVTIAAKPICFNLYDYLLHVRTTLIVTKKLYGVY